MKVLILYHDKSEHSRKVDEFVHDFTRLHPDGKLQVMSLETREGAEKAALYDAKLYPATLATRESGELLKLWEGDLPLMNEVAYYATQ